MTKRANEDSQAEEPSAKRSITSEQHHALKLLAAQDALNRMDFKTTNEICKEVSKKIGRLSL